MHSYLKNVVLKQVSYFILLLVAMLVFLNTNGIAQSGDAGVKKTITAIPLTGTTVKIDNQGNTLSNPFFQGGVGTSAAAVFTPDGIATLNNIQNVITLSLIEENPGMIPQGFSASVVFNVTYGASSTGTLTTLNNQALTVTYSSSQGAQYKARNYMSFANAAYVSVSIVSVTPTFANTAGPSFDGSVI